MSKGKQEPSFFEQLRAGLEECIAFTRGELELRTVEIPDAPPPWGAAEVLRLRQRLKMTPGVFAGIMNVSPRTVQHWERGERTPSQAALRLLQILDADPDAVARALGLRSVNGEAPPSRARTRAK